MFAVAAKCKQRLVLIGDDRQLGVMGAAFSANQRMCNLFTQQDYNVLQLKRTTFTRLKENGVPVLQLRVSALS